MFFVAYFGSWFIFYIIYETFFIAQECAHLEEEILLDVGSSEIGMLTNIVPITPQLALIGFFPIGNPFIIKDDGYPWSVSGNSGDF